jgi:hypothetical protein
VQISKAECADAFEQSQRLRNSFRYLQASAEALRCASLLCGAALSEACGGLYSDLQTATPSIVFGARSDDGSELGKVVVRIDSNALGASIDGTPLLLDPGNHEFTFTAIGFRPLRKTVVVLAGERFRPIVAVLTKAESTGAQGPLVGEQSLAPAPRQGIPVASYVLGGVGIAGFAGFVGFRVAGASDYAALARDCEPTCSRTSVDAARQKYVLSYVGLAVGGAASIAAVTLYLVSAHQTSRQVATLQLRPISNGATASFSAQF